MTPIDPTEFRRAVRRATGCELRRLRQRAGLTSSELADRMHTHRPIVCRIERGVHTTTVEVAARYARACGGGLGHVLLAIDLELGMLPRAPS